MLLYLPIHYQPSVGEDTLQISEIMIGSTTYKLVGVKYYYDNNLSPECLFTVDGFRTATAIHYLKEFSNYMINVHVADENNSNTNVFKLAELKPSFVIPADKVYIDSQTYDAFFAKDADPTLSYTTSVYYTATYHKYNYYNGESSRIYNFEKLFTEANITDKKPNYGLDLYYSEGALVISDELMCEIAEEVLKNSYMQASLFFENDAAAHDAAEKLQEKGYIAVPSDTTYEADAGTVISKILSCIVLVFVWVLSIVFLAFFINLCSSRTLSAFKGDMAIMRSMGIQVNVIRIGMYVRMLISLIPAFLVVILTAILIFTTPKFNEFFVYLYAWQYAVIFIGMIALTVRTTYKQIKKLFGESVKKSLKGGNAE